VDQTLHQGSAPRACPWTFHQANAGSKSTITLSEHRTSLPPLPLPRLLSGGNLGGAEHAVQNNLGGRIFFPPASVKSLIYGFHSVPGLQIIPLSRHGTHECWSCKSSWH
jgi:hypothetical protein